MAHSPAYFVAAGAADHAFSWEHAGASRIADPLIHRLIDLVRVGEPPVANAARYRQGATVMVRTRDGRTSTSTVYVPKGAGMLGIAWSDVDGKYRALLPNSGLAPDGIEESLEVIHRFRQIANVSMLTMLLH
jgi:2-methylcitrate dehydratase PrpD